MDKLKLTKIVLTPRGGKDVTMTIDEARDLMEETANMLRGMCMDPRIPQDTKEALWSRVGKLDGAVTAALEQQEECIQPCSGCPTPFRCKDTSGCASAGLGVPTYYVRHPDDTYTPANPQPRPLRPNV